MTPLPIVCAAAAAAGLLAGVLTRRWLAGLPRGAPVPPPWCEAALAAGGALAGGAVRVGWLDPRWAALLVVLCWLAVAGSATDLLRRRLPDALTLPALGLVLLALVPAGGAAVLRGLGGAVLFGGAYLLVHLLFPAALGGGDVKLAGPVGAAVAGAG
ncbi:prepilin peptidase [Pseudonocardia sp. ICBG1293]|uniref:prepilin peptidase n=1 Tax=Pseudonocardia sp. ICBG1293 TaxID=2844382 RepID=UPI001CCB9198|nr:prepilin peptidase [Pseudonocardia sp. ICBG1293]